MSNADNTCKDCQKRYLGCHSECEEYARFRESRLERSRKIAEGRAKERGMRAKWSETLRKRTMNRK